MRMGGQSHDPANIKSGNIPVTVKYLAGWDTGPFWKGAGIRSPVRPAHSESLYRLSDSRQLFPIQYLSV